MFPLAKLSRKRQKGELDLPLFIAGADSSRSRLRREDSGHGWNNSPR